MTVFIPWMAAKEHLIRILHAPDRRAEMDALRPWVSDERALPGPLRPLALVSSRLFAVVWCREHCWPWCGGRHCLHCSVALVCCTLRVPLVVWRGVVTAGLELHCTCGLSAVRAATSVTVTAVEWRWQVIVAAAVHCLAVASLLGVSMSRWKEEDKTDSQWDGIEQDQVRLVRGMFLIGSDPSPPPGPPRSSQAPPMPLA
jgi:hypothetical protein